MLAIAFALRGTLTAAEGLEREAFLELIRERCAADGRPFPENAARAAAHALFCARNVNDDAAGALGAAAARLCDARGASRTLVARYCQIADRRLAQHLTVEASVRETLERIASLGIPRAVLCNGWSRIAHREAQYAGFTGEVLVSEDIGCAKPSRAAFDRLLHALGVPADRIWYVGNDPQRDIDGAAAAGLTAIWLNAAGASYPADLRPPAFTIADIGGVLGPLCEAYTRSLLSLRHLMRTALDWRDGHVIRPDDVP